MMDKTLLFWLLAFVLGAPGYQAQRNSGFGEPKEGMTPPPMMPGNFMVPIEVKIRGDSEGKQGKTETFDPRSNGFLSSNNANNAMMNSLQYLPPTQYQVPYQPQALQQNAAYFPSLGKASSYPQAIRPAPLQIPAAATGQYGGNYLQQEFSSFPQNFNSANESPLSTNQQEELKITLRKLQDSIRSSGALIPAPVPIIIPIRI